ncbi:MAG: type III secretion inner membrane ring lipoprotein SctJ [Hyphomicrobiales bacterium]|nr:type III secretion inner membrane ring lipoprotein SctJ [Hyphomicrobiales bacterium]
MSMRIWQSDFGTRLVKLGAAVLMAGFLAGCKAELYTGLGERETNEMTAVLTNEGISASRERDKDGNYALLVERGDFAQAVSVLSSRGLPRQQFKGLGEVFNDEKLVSTPFEERARFMHALNEERAASLTQIAGVASARVHIMMPETSPLDREKAAARASVFIYHNPDTDVRRHVPLIKNLIVNSVDGLNYEDVTVALFPANGPVAAGKSGQSISSSIGGLAPFLLAAILLGVAWIVFRRDNRSSARPGALPASESGTNRFVVKR